MGWASGSEVLWRILKLIKPMMPTGYRNRRFRKKFYGKLIDIFEDRDCDTIHEAFSPAWPELEEVYRDKHPDEFDDSDCIEDGEDE